MKLLTQREGEEEGEGEKGIEIFERRGWEGNIWLRDFVARWKWD